MDSVGDLARALVLRTNQVRLRTEMDRLAVEVSTGLKRDPARHLAGDVSGLVALDRNLARLDVFRVNASEAKLITGSMQQSLSTAQDRVSGLGSSLLSAELVPTAAMTRTLAEDAASTLRQIVSNLNQSVAGRFLFSGTATDTPPLADAETLIDEARLAVAGLTNPTAADVGSALDAFFAPGGTYETVIYQGSADGLRPLQLGENDSADIDVRATDDALRAMLKPVVMAAIAAEPGLGFDVDMQVDLLRSAGIGMVGAQEDVTNLRARLGATETRVEQAVTFNAAERTGTSMAKLDLIGADPYETAARYESVRMQLEGLYAITARSQRLSLTAFL